MRPRPDPLQRLALLRHDGPVVDLPAGWGDEERAGPAVEFVANASRERGGDDRQPDAADTRRRMTAEGSPPIAAGGSTAPDRGLLTGPPDPRVPDGGAGVIQGSPPVSRAPGRHRHPEEGGPAPGVGELPPSGGEIPSLQAFSAFGGWVPDDDGGEWEGYDNPEPLVGDAFPAEHRRSTRHRAVVGDDPVGHEREPAVGDSVVNVARSEDSEHDDSTVDSQSHWDVAGAGGGDVGGVDSEIDDDDGAADDGDRHAQSGDGWGDDGGDGDASSGDGRAADGADGGGDGGAADGADGGGDGGDGDDDDGDDEDGDDFAGLDEQEGPLIRARRLGNRPWGRLAELWVPESLRDARIDPGRRGLLVLLLVAAVAAVATAIGVWRDRPEPRPVETVALAPAANGAGLAVLAPVANPSDEPISGAPPISAGAPISGATADSGTGAATASTAPPAEIVVSVTGLVAHPGVVTLPAGARVTDAIAAAGGSTAEANLTGLNLAAKLADGDSVVIAGASAGAGNSGVSGAGSAHAPSPGNPAASQGQQTSSSLIDLNTADEGALDSLPGVGPVMAQNILAWRQQNGRFSSVEQLQEISGIGPARYAQISALVTVS